MARTRFLARLFGLFFLILAVAFAVNWPGIAAAFGELVHDPAFLTVAGMLILASGLAIVLTHNVWRGITGSVVTLLGWASVAKGVFLLWASPALVARIYAAVGVTHLQMFYVVVLGVLGVGLVAGGFLAKTSQ